MREFRCGDEYPETVRPEGEAGDSIDRICHLATFPAFHL
jgi:hypothetical protein